MKPDCGWADSKGIHHKEPCTCIRDNNPPLGSPSRPEPGTAEKRAREIAETMYAWIVDSGTCAHTFRNRQRCKDCMVDGIAAALREYGDKVRAEALKGFPNVREFDYAQGWNDCRAKVTEIVESTNLDDKSYARTRAVAPSEGGTK